MHVLDIDGWFDFCIKRVRGQQEDLSDDKTLFEDAIRRNRFTENDIFAMPTWFMIPFTRAKKKMFIRLPQDQLLRNIFLEASEEFPAFTSRL